MQFTAANCGRHFVFTGLTDNDDWNTNTGIAYQNAYTRLPDEDGTLPVGWWCLITNVSKANTLQIQTHAWGHSPASSSNDSQRLWSEDLDTPLQGSKQSMAVNYNDRVSRLVLVHRGGSTVANVAGNQVQPVNWVFLKNN